MQTAEAMVYAFTIKDHSMGASFKQYDDRQFCNGHRTVTMGMPMGYFKKAICQNKREETHLYLHYCEMPQQKQLKQEEWVVKTIEKLDKSVLKKLENLQCKVIFEKVGTIYTIRFLTGLEEVIAEIDEKGMVDIRVYSKFYRDIVECVVTVKKENGKDVICFESGLEELLLKMKARKKVMVKFYYKVEGKVYQIYHMAA